MSLPEDVTTFTLTFGPYLDATGAAVLKDLRGSLTPISDSGRPIRILHPDSGSMIIPIEIPFTIDDNGTATIEDLPHTDNASLFPHPFRYKVTWGESVRALSGTVLKPSDKPFAVPVSSGSVVDFDKQMEAVGQPGVQVTPQGVPPGGLTNYVMAKKSAADYDTKWMSLSGYVTDGQLDSTLEDYVTNIQMGTTLEGYISDEELATAIENLNLPSYALDTDLTAAIEAIDFTPYALDTDLTAAIEAIDFTPYVTTENLESRNYVSDEELADALEALESGYITPAERTKLAGIATSATANATDAALRDRATHTGVQTTASITDLREYIEDTIGGMLRAVGADLDISYDDANSEITIDYTGVTNDPESIRDAIGAAMVGLGNISVLVDDNADTITIITSATVNSTDAALRDRSTHTGTQLAATISNLAAAIDAAVGGRITAVEATLAAATASATANTLAKRDTQGRIALSGQVSGEHAARKDYVDGAGATANTADTIVRRDASGWIRGGRVIAESGPPSAANELTRKDYVDALGSSTNVADTVVRRDSSSTAHVGTLTAAFAPSSAAHVTRKDYVDGVARTTPTSVWATANGTASMSGATTATLYRWTLSGNLTIGTMPTPADLGLVIQFVLKQAASGGPYTVTWPTIKWAGDAPAPAMPTVANAELIVNLLWTGTAWRGLVAGSFFP